MFRKQDTKIPSSASAAWHVRHRRVLANMGVPRVGLRHERYRDHAPSLQHRLLGHPRHRADNLAEADVVVVSSAIKGYNPEVEPRERARSR